jgi:4-alpha-glucanotransferase
MMEWFRQDAPDTERRRVRDIRRERRIALEYLGSDGREFHWDLIRAAFSSVADTVVTPVQDVLGLGREARMNRPGTARNNWNWRLAPGSLQASHAQRLAELSRIYGRDERNA